jgi:hypothetical protein
MRPFASWITTVAAPIHASNIYPQKPLPFVRKSPKQPTLLDWPLLVRVYFKNNHQFFT